MDGRIYRLTCGEIHRRRKKWTRNERAEGQRYGETDRGAHGRRGGREIGRWKGIGQEGGLVEEGLVW